MKTKLLYRLRNNIWIIPLFYCVLAVSLAFVVVYIDIYVTPIYKDVLPFFLTTKIDLAKEILGTIAGALLTMTTITFSTIMVVLTTYSSQFSPRVLKNFISDPRTMRVLGIFMGGFLYSILSLSFMRSATFQYEVISAVIAVLLACICLIIFAYFINNVANSIQVSNLIQSLMKDIEQEISREQKEYEKGHVKVVNISPDKNDYPISEEIKSSTYGFIQYIDYEKLRTLAVKYDLIVEINHPPGDFILKGQTLLTVHSKNAADCIKTLKDEFDIGKERVVYQDIEYGIQKMTDVALRALSPGINDPNTAIHCIQCLSQILINYLKYTGNYVIYKDEDDLIRVITCRKNTEQVLYQTFSQISYYGREDISVLAAILDAFQSIEQFTSEEIHAETQRFKNFVYERFNHNVITTLDQKMLKEKFKVTSKQ